MDATPNQTAPGFGVSADDLRSVEWQETVDSAARRECYSFYESFVEQAKNSTAAGDKKRERVFHLLSGVTSLWLNLDSGDDPFAPMFVDYQAATRTTATQDLSDKDLESLAVIIKEIREPELRARVGDILWVRKKNHEAARLAIDAYIESAARLEDGENWPPFVKRLQRALQLGAKLGWNQEAHKKAIAAIEGAIAKYSLTEKGFLSARLMELLFHDRVGDPGRYSSLAEQLAQRAEAVSAWDIAQDYWQLKAAWDGRRGKDGNAPAAKHKTAEMLEKRADDYASGKARSFMAASHWMQQAIEVLRNTQAPSAEIGRAHQKLLGFQQRSMAEMEPIQVSYDDIPGLQETTERLAQEAVKKVSGRSFEDAMLCLACVILPSRPDALRKRVESSSQGVFSQLFGASVVRADGQTAETRAPLATTDPQAREDAVVKEMYSNARNVDWPFRVQTCIDPARNKILEEHPGRLRDFEFLVRNNPFVPRGREGLFLRGLHAGLHGDLVLAMHILIPQIENSIRTLFTEAGVITSKLESDKTQDERDLGWLLSRPEMATIFTPGMAFDLRGLLVERFGCNLRNDLFHGFYAEAQMLSPYALYVWWLVLRLCCVPIIKAKTRPQIPPDLQP